MQAIVLSTRRHALQDATQPLTLLAIARTRTTTVLEPAQTNAVATDSNTTVTVMVPGAAMITVIAATKTIKRDVKIIIQ